MSTCERPAIRVCHAVNQRNRAIDLAKRPQNQRQIDHGGDARVMPKRKARSSSRPGSKRASARSRCTRASTILPRTKGDASNPMRDAGLGRIGSRLDVGEESCRVRSHRRQLAPHVTAGPQAVVGRQALGRVLVAEGRLAGACEGFRRFRRAVAPRRDQRVAVSDLQLRQSLPTRRCRFDLVGLRQRRRAAPPPRRSPAFRASAKSLQALARGRRALRRGGRSIDRAWRAPAPRAVRSCACLAASRPRWRSGRLLRRRGIGGVALQQDFAARPMQFRFERAVAECGRTSPALRRGSRWRGRGSPARASASASAIFKRPSNSQNVLFAQLLDAAAHVLEPVAGAPPAAVAQPSRNAPNAPYMVISCSRASRASSNAFGAARTGRGASIRTGPSAFLHKARMPIWVTVRDPKLGPVNEGNRAIDLAERPRGDRQIDHCGDAGVQAEAKSQIVVAAGFEQGERALQVIPSLAILAGEPASDPGGAMGDAGLRRIRVSPRRR